MPDRRNNPIVEEKSLIRRQVRAARSNLSPHGRSMKSHALCTKLGRILGLAQGKEDDASVVMAHMLADDAATTGAALPEGSTIALYAAFNDEASLDELIGLCHRGGMKIALPCMNPKGSDRPMDMRAVSRSAWNDGAVPFVNDPLTRLAADDKALAPFPLVAPDAIDAIIVPLVAFDRQRRRLGYGGGNYDAYLPLLSEGCIVIGAAFAEQRVERVPAESHDLPLPAIVYA